ncbi:MAG: hypothetical protein LBL63_02710, partial [Clostridiales Family XIII bacterium]|nr:hypothetical protein [Clostridiales Family XIII bacterium]
MKQVRNRILSVLCAAMLLFAMLLSGCGGETASIADGKTADAKAASDGAASETGEKADAGDKAEVFEIGEKFFIQQCNDIYYNPQSYEGDVVRLEGIYDEYFDEYKGETSHAVYRNGPGCCGNDGVAGFVFKYDGSFPVQDEWIEVTGVVELETY